MMEMAAIGFIVVVGVAAVTYLLAEARRLDEFDE